MTHPTESRSELYLRFTRRSMVFLLFIILAFSAAGLAMAVWPDGAVSRWLERAPWVFPVAAVVIFSVQQIAARGHRWNSALPEAKAVLNDEWRRLNIDRATRVAFIVALVAQVPLGLLFARLPPGRGVIAMAVATVAVGMSTLAGLFLFFDREARDGR